MRRRWWLHKALLRGGGTPPDEGGIAPWVEYGKRIEATQRIAPIQDGFAGENISLYNGATTFSVTDIDVPGNFAIPVRLARRLAIELQPQDQYQPYDSLLHGVGNWEVEVPYMAATYPTSTGWNAQRCSLGSVPDLTTGPLGIFLRGEYWSGISIHVPGRGDATALAIDPQVPVPTNGGPYRLSTTERDVLDCIPMKSGLPGEGFRMTTSSGIRYYFDVGTARTASKLAKIFNVDYGGAPHPTVAYLERNRYYLLASRVEDRFGNAVQFQYDGAGHPTRISASDGREITLTYSNGRLVSAASHGRTWQYQYNGVGDLVTVLQPDASRWQYAYSGTLLPPAPPPFESLPLPWCRGAPAFISQDYTVIATHPGGATATFQFNNLRHFRSGVHASECMARGNPPTATYELLVPYYYDIMSLTQKTIAGPGLAAATWSYDYGRGAYGLWGLPTAAPSYPCTTCVKSRDITVSNPDGTSIRYTFGIEYRLNDGRLLQTQTLRPGGTAIRTDASTYLSDAAAAGQAFYPQYGQVLGGISDPMTASIRPIVQTVIGLDGATFTKAVSAFDALARPVKQSESSNLGFSRIVETSYYDSASYWVLGQVAQRKVNGIVAESTSYGANALPAAHSVFGKLRQTFAWNGDGTLASITDGNNHAATASNWKRGVPQAVGYPDGTGESATVSDAGWITAVTDENGFVTSYGYDPMGRIASITYPVGDDVAWNATLSSFAPVAGSEYGIPAGHWKQTVHTGNGYAVTYFDALWRPLVAERYDAGNKPNTLSQVVTRYDAMGRKIFTSYPTNAASSFGQAVPGVATGYDALGRVVQELQDSEIGVLPTATQYLSGFKSRVTDPRGYTTTTSYQAFAEPDTSHPVSVVMPEGATTAIVRDVFGKPVSITRSGSYGGSGLAVSRTFVYDGNHLLCKRIEPETGGTLFAYDGADNLAWSAPGTALTGNSCDRGSVSASQTITRSYDPRNRLTAIAYPDGISNTQYTYAADGRMLSAVNGNGGSSVKTQFAYDKRRLQTAETLTVPGASVFAIGYGHDANGHLATLGYPDGRIVTFAPNALGQPTQASGYAAGVAYFPNGAIRQFTYGDGSVHTLTQNVRGLPERSRDGYAGTAVLDNTSAYDDNGNVAAITDGLPGNVGNVDLRYDGLNRLTGAISPMFAGNHQASFAYDPVDNLRAAGVGNGNQYSYAYDTANRLVSMSGTQSFYFAYDARGNQTQSNAQVYTFDLADRLRAANGLESYLYDAAGRRARKVSAFAGSTTYYAYDHTGALLHEADGAGAAKSDYVYLSGSLIAKVTQGQAAPQPDPPPAAPASITVPATSSTGNVTVSWAAVSGVTSYVLQQQANGGSWAQIYSGNATSKAITGLANGSYVYRVQACNSAGCGAFATSGTLTVSIPQAPPAPASITVPATSSTGNVTVSWAAVSGATSYVLQQQANGGSWTQVYSGGATSQALTGLPNGSYVYRVQACNSAGCGAFATSGTLTVSIPQAPPAPASITVPATSNTGNVTVSWAAVSGATSYVLQQQANGGSWAQIYSGGATSQALTGLANGSYVYRVQACNSVGCGAFVTSGTLTVALIPSPPASINVPASSYAPSFGVSWGASANATNYVLEESVNGGGWGVVWNGNATSTTVTVPASGTYRFQVAACAAGGCSGFTASGNVAVTLPPTSAPGLSGPASSGTGTFTLNWGAVAGGTRYQLNQNLNGAVTTPYNAGGTSWSSSGLADGAYGYQVFACNAAGCGPGSNVLTVQVTRTPAAPASVTAPVSVASGKGFIVRWVAVSGATSYDLQQTQEGQSGGTIYQGPDTKFTAQLVGNHIRYRYAARACNAGGCSAWTQAANWTEVFPPGEPIGIGLNKPATSGGVP